MSDDPGPPIRISVAGASSASSSMPEPPAHSIDAVHLTFTAVLERPGSLPGFRGSMIRGVFGHVLKSTVCQVEHGECSRCHLRSVCPFPAIFDGRPPVDREFMRRYPAIPQPYMLEVPGPDPDDSGAHGIAQRPRDPRPSAELTWGVRLIGEARHQWPYLIEAFQRAGRRGLGGRRARFKLVAVQDARNGRLVYLAEKDELHRTSEYRISPSSPPSTDTLRFTFETPVHLRIGGSDAPNAIGGLDLVLAGRRRWSTLLAFHGIQPGRDPRGDGPPPARLHAGDFETLEDSLRYWSIQRYSGRQDQKVPLGGFVGSITIRGPWHLAGDWLTTVHETHLGKHASFGLGRVHWEAVER